MPRRHLPVVSDQPRGCVVVVLGAENRVRRLRGRSGRDQRRFVDVYDRFPQPGRSLLETIAVVYRSKTGTIGGLGNVCERALKKAILHRKNALFYKTRNGAQVGDLFMSLIYTCQLNQANPFDYLTELQRHADALAACPQLWMPWNYRDALA